MTHRKDITGKTPFDNASPRTNREIAARSQDLYGYLHDYETDPRFKQFALWLQTRSRIAADRTES